MKYIINYINFNNYEEFFTNDEPLLNDCIYEFIEFLKMENVFKIFVKNLYQCNDMWKYRFWNNHNSLCKKDKKEKYLTNSFPWINTEEHYDFWEKINRKWIQKIKK
jgi:hypothetical protein